MEFRASLYATRALGYFITVFFLPMICGFAYVGQYRYVGLFVVAAAILIIKLRTRKMSFGDQIFRYDGWFDHVEIPYSEIIKVESSESLGYPAAQSHGIMEYRITTSNKKVWISMLWFNKEARKQFHNQIKRHR